MVIIFYCNIEYNKVNTKPNISILFLNSQLSTKLIKTDTDSMLKEPQNIY
jgi:hypothetical protein